MAGRAHRRRHPAAGRCPGGNDQWSAHPDLTAPPSPTSACWKAARGLLASLKGLLRTIIADAAPRGRDRVGLEVDADSPTGAHGALRRRWAGRRGTSPSPGTATCPSPPSGPRRLALGAASARRAPSGCRSGWSTPTKRAPSLTPTRPRSSRREYGERLLERGVDVDHRAQVAGARRRRAARRCAGSVRVTGPAQPAVEPTKSATKSSAGPAEQLGRRAVLREPAAGGEDRDPVAHPHRLVDVVGDDHDGLVELALQAQELVLQAHPHDRVDGAERLVHQQHRRVGGQRPGDADALAAGRRRAGAGSGRRTSPGRGRPGSISSCGAARGPSRFDSPYSSGTVVDVGATIRLVREQARPAG